MTPKEICDALNRLYDEVDRLSDESQDRGDGNVSELCMAMDDIESAMRYMKRVSGKWKNE